MPADRAGSDSVTAEESWLDGYSADSGGGDLFRGAQDPVGGKWHAMARGLAALADGDRAAIHDEVSRQITDLGMTFLIAGDEEERIWPLTPMPLIIGSDEWAAVERGLVQRAQLMERLASDIYGPQRLVAEGHLPSALVTGSPFFARNMLGKAPRGGHFIHVYAADLARGPQGQWRVLRDRVRLATGIGYALENRMAMSRMADATLSELNVRRLASFFSELREGIARDCQRENPRIALLTPGRFNQTYPEQAHLARYLGLPLVEGRDLSVIEDKLYVRTIAGPKRIDAVWRWINTNALDPLTFDAKSQLGVANLFGAWASGGLEIANRPGVEVLESSAFSAFMPRLCRILLGEEPILPTVATWWCGQAAEAQIVRDRLEELALVPAFGRPVDGLDQTQPVAGAALDGSARAALLDAMRRRPMDYCGQEIVHLSTTPALIEGELVARPFTIRAFVARTAQGDWSVMPGGFARLSSSDDMPMLMMGEADLSADVCIVGDGPSGQAVHTVLGSKPAISRGGGILASQAADNLYWFGRYNERAEMTVRIVRSILGSSLEADGGFARSEEVRRSLANLLFLWGAVTDETARQPLPVVCGRALAESSLPGGVAALMRKGQEVALSLRERFARDVWRIVSQPAPTIDLQRPQFMQSNVKALIERFSALSGLTAENMVRGPAWRFLDMGRRVERGLSVSRIAQHLTGLDAQTDALGVLLDLCDSQIVYRSRYLTGPVLEPVLDLVLLDPENPRSLVFQLAEIASHLEALPSLREDKLPEEPLRMARAMLGELQAAKAAQFTFEQLSSIEDSLLGLSNIISTRYFLPFDELDTQPAGALLG